MKKKLIIGTIAAGIIVATSLLAWSTTKTAHMQPNNNLTTTTEGPIDKATQALNSDPTSDTTTPPSNLPTDPTNPLPPIPATTLLDINSSAYANGQVYSDEFTPTSQWTINVDYSCPSNTAFEVATLQVVSNNPSPASARLYNYINQTATKGNYSTIQTLLAPVYLRISAGCSWHITVTENADPLYNTIRPCTLNDSYLPNNKPLSCGV